MPSLANILLPTDFSPRSAVAARHALAIAGQFCSHITILHVAGPGEQERAREQLDSWLAGEGGSLEIARVLAQGDPAGEIVRYAHTRAADLIVMPTRGWGPLRRFILGSVTAKVLHDARCPVWTGVHVEEMAEQPEPPRVIACAVDLDSGDAATLRWASELAASVQACLLAIHAIPFLEFHPQFHCFEADLRKKLVGEAREKIARALDGFPASIHVEGGLVPRIVRATTQDRTADLLVIGRSSGGSMLGRLRTNSYAIIREAPCPVISV